MSDARPSPCESKSRGARWAYLVAGCFFFALGAIGVVLPLLPTTPFLLLAAACFARGSLRFYRLLTGSKLFGPLIRDWQEKGTVSRKTKTWAVILVVLTFTTTIGFAVTDDRLRIGLVILAAGLLILLWRLPTEQRTAA